MKRVAIIGSNGFIGKSIIENIQNPSIEFTQFIRKKSNFLPKISNCRFIDLKSIKAESLANIDVVILCASETNPASNLKDYSLEIEKNINPHILFFNELIKSDVRDIIYLSSGGAVYGNSKKSKISEDHPTKPKNPYGYGKLCIELAIQSIFAESDKRFTILRPSNPVGVHQLKSLGTHGLVATVFINTLKNKPIRVVGNGETIRDYFLVKDLCILIEKLVLFKKNKNEIINASSGEGNSINRVIEVVSEVLNKKSKIIYHGNNSEINRNVLCNSYAREKYDWKPESSLFKIVQDFKKDLNNRS